MGKYTTKEPILLSMSQRTRMIKHMGADGYQKWVEDAEKVRKRKVIIVWERNK